MLIGVLNYFKKYIIFETRLARCQLCDASRCLQGEGEMEMIMVMRQVMPCDICGWSDGHGPDCELQKIQELQERNVYIDCPKCNERAVGLNQSDFYECRLCHTQFSTSGLVDCEEPEEATLIDLQNDRAIPVRVIKKEGCGEFPIDKAIEDLRKIISEIDPEFDFEEEE